MQVSIEVATWHQAHHLGCALADAEYEQLQAAERWLAKYGEKDEVYNALLAYAKFFRQVAKQVTKQAGPLNAYAPSAQGEAGIASPPIQS